MPGLQLSGVICHCWRFFFCRMCVLCNIIVKHGAGAEGVTGGNNNMSPVSRSIGGQFISGRNFMLHAHYSSASARLHATITRDFCGGRINMKGNIGDRVAMGANKK